MKLCLGVSVEYAVFEGFRKLDKKQCNWQMLSERQNLLFDIFGKT